MSGSTTSQRGAERTTAPREGAKESHDDCPLRKGAEKLLSAAIDLSASGDDIKVSLIDLDDYAADITGATNATPIVITSAAHGLTSGQRVLITGVLGNTAANGVFLCTVATSDTFSLQTVAAGANVAGNGTYTAATGLLVKLDVDEFYDDLAGVVATSGNLSSKTVTNGIFDAANPTISGVTGDPTEAVVIWQDTTVAATSPLIAIALGTFTPNGSDVVVTFDAGGAFAIC